MRADCIQEGAVPKSSRYSTENSEALPEWFKASPAGDAPIILAILEGLQRGSGNARAAQMGDRKPPHPRLRPAIRMRHAFG